MAAVKTKARVMVGLGRSIDIFWLGHTHFVWPIAVEMTAVQIGSVIFVGQGGSYLVEKCFVNTKALKGHYMPSNLNTLHQRFTSYSL